jgi:hypothetical protein
VKQRRLCRSAITGARRNRSSFRRRRQGRAASELATIAVAWALLHELRHIRHQREGSGADPHSEDKAAKHAEELSCDAFATTSLLEQIDLCARATVQSADLVRQKRQLGIYFGLFSVTLLAKDKWGKSKTHPAVQARIDAELLWLTRNPTSQPLGFGGAIAPF